MKTVGIIGGIGPESTVEYYRLIIQLYRQQEPDGTYPQIVINSINMKKMLDLIGANNLADVTAYLLAEIRKLARAGADFGLLASNTPQETRVFLFLTRRSCMLSLRFQGYCHRDCITTRCSESAIKRLVTDEYVPGDWHRRESRR
jgi:hypothetical protein